MSEGSVSYGGLMRLVYRHGEAYGELMMRACEVIGVRDALDECLHSPTASPTPELFRELRDALRRYGEANRVCAEAQERLSKHILSAVHETYYFDERGRRGF